MAQQQYQTVVDVFLREPHEEWMLFSPRGEFTGRLRGGETLMYWYQHGDPPAWAFTPGRLVGGVFKVPTRKCAEHVMMRRIENGPDERTNSASGERASSDRAEGAGGRARGSRLRFLRR